MVGGVGVAGGFLGWWSSSTCRPGHPGEEGGGAGEGVGRAPLVTVARTLLGTHDLRPIRAPDALAPAHLSRRLHLGRVVLGHRLLLFWQRFTVYPIRFFRAGRVPRGFEGAGRVPPGGPGVRLGTLPSGLGTRQASCREVVPTLTLLLCFQFCL